MLSPFSQTQPWLPVLCDDEQTSRWAIFHDNSDVFFLPRGARSEAGSVDCVFRLGSWEERPFSFADLFVEVEGGTSTANNFLTVLKGCFWIKMFLRKRLGCSVP